MTNTGQQRHSFLASFRPNLRHINTSASKESGHSGNSGILRALADTYNIHSHSYYSWAFGILAWNKRCTCLLKYSIL